MTGRELRPVPVNLREITARASSKLLGAENVADLERRYRVWSLRKDGYSYREISVALGITESIAKSDVTVIAKRLVSDLGETVEESRMIQVVRLDALIKKYHPMAEQGNLSAAAMVLAIEARRSKLLALDTPETKKLDVTGIRQYVGVNLDLV